MKHIGDVLRESMVFPIKTNPSLTPAPKVEPKCPICHDAGWLRMDVPIGHRNFGRLLPCECTVERQDRKLQDDMKQLSNLEAFSDLTFDSFDSSIDEVREAFLVATEYAQTLQGWLFLEGRFGVGKTHLAVAIANHVKQHHPRMSIYFAVVPDLLDQLRATFDPSNGVAYDERFNLIRNVNLLILDDLGTENTTPWAKEKLFQLLNFRYNEYLPTVVTTNQEDKHIDGRIVSRLRDTKRSRSVCIDAEDYRQRGRVNYYRRR